MGDGTEAANRIADLLNEAMRESHGGQCSSDIGAVARMTPAVVTRLETATLKAYLELRR